MERLASRKRFTLAGAVIGFILAVGYMVYLFIKKPEPTTLVFALAILPFNALISAFLGACAGLIASLVVGLFGHKK